MIVAFIGTTSCMSTKSHRPSPRFSALSFAGAASNSAQKVGEGSELGNCRRFRPLLRTCLRAATLRGRQVVRAVRLELTPPCGERLLRPSRPPAPPCPQDGPQRQNIEQCNHSSLPYLAIRRSGRSGVAVADARKLARNSHPTAALTASIARRSSSSQRATSSTLGGTNESSVGAAEG